MLEELGISIEDWEQAPASTRAALALLWQQNRMLQSRCAVYEHQVQRLTVEVERIKRLELEVAELRERLGRNSQNSSKPPSSDPPHASGPARRESGKAKRGGQPGHKGKRRQLLPVDKVDQVVDLRPVDCSKCGHLLLGEDPVPVRGQISELPPIRAVVTEYRSHRLQCSACGSVTRAAWPTDLPAGEFGPRLAAVVVYLTGRLNLSHRDVIEALGALHGVEVGLGSVAALQKQVSEALAGVVETARQFVKQQAVHYVDETCWLEGAKMQWLWVNATPQVSSFRILPGRGRNQAEEVIGRAAKGIFTTDRYNGYHWLGVRRRQICWAHLKRDYQAMSERSGGSEKLGEELLEQTRELFVIWGRFCDGNITRRQFQIQQFQIQMRPIKAEFGKLLRQGAMCEDSKTGACCRQILQWEKSLWTYVHTAGAEPTNNLAERSLRRGVLWRKKSFGTQSKEGTRFVERVLTVVTTLRQQKRDVLDFLTTACQNSAGLAQPLCLLPETSSM